MFFCLHAYCIPIKGKLDNIILDLFNFKYLKIPLFVLQLLEQLDGANTIESLKRLNKENEADIDNVLAFLVAEDFGFYTENPEQYPKIETSWSIPEYLDSAIIEISEPKEFDYLDLFYQLDNLRCANIEIWALDNCNLLFLETILKEFETCTFKCIKVLIDASHLSAFDISEYCNGLLKFDKMDALIFYNSDTSKGLKGDRVFHSKSDLWKSNYEESEYGKINFDLNFFLEAKNFNPFCYKKVSIDSRGEIKNFLSFERSFGNIKKERLNPIIESESFRASWYITNDYILDIKDSPLRYCYMITDELEPVPNSNYFKMKRKSDQVGGFPWETII